MRNILCSQEDEKKNVMHVMPTTGIEPVTFALRERRSTTEPNRLENKALETACQNVMEVFSVL